MNLPLPLKSHIWILPVCWTLAAACWSFPIWKYSHSVYTIGGGFISQLSWALPADVAYILGFLASLVEVVAIAIGLKKLGAPLSIYAVTPIVPSYVLLTFHGASIRHYFTEFVRYSAWSFYITALLALMAFSALQGFKRLCKRRTATTRKVA